MAWAASQADIDAMARLTFTVGETGVLVTGEQSAVSACTAQLGNLARMWGQPVTVSYYQWQRLRPERVRVIETDHLAGVIAHANEQLAADLRRDSEMVGLLQARLATYAAQRPLERLHPLASRDLQATMTSLRHDIEAFADARRMQVSSWSVLTQPTLRDAMQELRDRTAATGQHAITQASVVAKEIGGTATVWVRP
jgi:hypothetical protein